MEQPFLPESEIPAPESGAPSDVNLSPEQQAELGELVRRLRADNRE
jgi:hypothetical protein